MITKTPREQIRAYEASRANGEFISQSKLKLLTKGLNAFLSASTEEEAKKYFEEKEWQIVGSGVDCRLTESDEEFYLQYMVTNVPKPSDTIMSIVNHIFDQECRLSEGRPTESLEGISDGANYELISEAIEFHSYQSNWKMETKVKKVIEEGGAYYLSLVECLGKQILSFSQGAIIQAIVDSIRGNVLTRRFFVQEYCPSYIDVHHQKIIVVEYRGLQIMMLLDILEIDHERKTIKVWDFKTLHGLTTSFPYAVKDRRYDFQDAIYTIGISIWQREQPELAGYTIINPGFIAETTKPGAQGNPIICTMTDQIMKIAIHGFREYKYLTLNNQSRENVVVQSNRVMGINETIDEYKWYLENGFGKERRLVENNNTFELNWEGFTNESAT